MYDWPEVQGQNDTFWQRVAAALSVAGISASDSLDRSDRLTEIWEDPNLLLGQTCGLPLVRGEAGSAIPVARPTYAVEGCSPGMYSSVVLARTGREALSDFAGSCVVINGWNSQSGCNALKDAFYDLLSEGPFFSNVVVSGAHRKSADLVAAGGADLCALDAVAWALYRHVEPERAASLSEVHWTRAMPSLPFITGQNHAGDLERLHAALAEACVGNGLAVPVDVLPASTSDYAPVLEMDRRLAKLVLGEADLA